MDLGLIMHQGQWLDTDPFRTLATADKLCCELGLEDGRFYEIAAAARKFAFQRLCMEMPQEAYDAVFFTGYQEPTYRGLVRR